MKPELWIQYPGMKELVLKFVAPGLWEKHKSELARKVCMSELWIQYPGMKELVLKFVAPGLWEKHKSELARKVCHIKLLVMSASKQN